MNLSGERHTEQRFLAADLVARHDHAAVARICVERGLPKALTLFCLDVVNELDDSVEAEKTVTT